MLRYLIVFGLLLSGCASTDDGQSSTEDFILANQSDYLSQEELKNLKRKALTGDGEAAYMLSNYYEYADGDHKMSRYWLRKAATLGWPVAQYSLGMFVFNKAKTEAQRQEGISWLEKASANGFPEAKADLKRIRANLKK